MSIYRPNSYHPHSFSEDKSQPEGFKSLVTQQPFLPYTEHAPLDYLLVGFTLQTQRWESLMPAEQTAYSLAQITALRVLPPLSQIASGNALLDYRVRLRDYLNDHLVEELAAVLAEQHDDLTWQQVDANHFVCVIYYGVAACIDTTAGDENLYLRYANERAEAIGHARYKTEIPLSLVGLQEILFNRIDELLAEVRQRTQLWLVG